MGGSAQQAISWSVDDDMFTGPRVVQQGGDGEQGQVGGEEARAYDILPPYGSLGCTYDFDKKYKGRCFCGRAEFEVGSDPLTTKVDHFPTDLRLHGASSRWTSLFYKQNVRFTPSSKKFLKYAATGCVCLASSPCPPVP